MKISLPIKEPYITTYPPYANMMALTDQYLDTSNHNSYMNWFVMQYTNAIYYNEDYMEYGINYVSAITFDNVFRSNEIKGNTILYNESFNGCFLLDTWGTFSEFAKQRIEDGFAVHLYLNERFLPAARVEQDFNHEAFIFAFDPDDDIFYLSEFYAGNPYSSYQISGQDLNNSFSTFTALNSQESSWHYRSKNIHVMTYKLYDQLDIDFEPDKFVFLMNRWNDAKQYSTYGHGRYCYDMIMNNLLKDPSRHNTRQNLHIMCDHKKAWLRSAGYLMDTNKMKKDRAVLEDINILMNDLLVARNLHTKGMISGKFNVEKIIDIYKNAYDLDISITERILQNVYL